MRRYACVGRVSQKKTVVLELDGHVENVRNGDLQYIVTTGIGTWREFAYKEVFESPEEAIRAYAQRLSKSICDMKVLEVFQLKIEGAQKRLVLATPENMVIEKLRGVCE